jgi:hypothetical protein
VTQPPTSHFDAGIGDSVCRPTRFFRATKPVIHNDVELLVRTVGVGRTLFQGLREDIFKALS